MLSRPIKIVRGVTSQKWLARITYRWVPLIVIGVCYAHVAGATLGERVAAGSVDTSSLRPSDQPADHLTYTVRATDRNGMHLREYINGEGFVFAITWQGARHPDLIPLLGAYAEAYQTASREARPERGRSYMGVVRGEDIVVEKFGHLRAVRGRAFVPSLLPAGVGPDALP